MRHSKTSQIRRGSRQHPDCLVGKEEEQAESQKDIEDVSSQQRSREDKWGDGCHELGKVRRKGRRKGQANTVSAYGARSPLAGTAS